MLNQHGSGGDNASHGEEQPVGKGLEVHHGIVILLEDFALKH